MQAAVCVQMAKVAGVDPGCVAGRVTQVAQEAGAADADGAVRTEGQRDVVERAADAARIVVAGAIDRDHRAAFRQAITFEYRQAEALGFGKQTRRHRCAANGQIAQVCRLGRAGPKGGDEGQQKLRYENRRACLGGVEGVQHPGRIDAGTAGQADAFARQQAGARTGEKRHVESGDVFQQGGEGQHVQVTVAGVGAACLAQGFGHRFHAVAAQAHAFRGAGGAGGEGDLGGALR